MVRQQVKLALVQVVITGIAIAIVLVQLALLVVNHLWVNTSVASYIG